MRYQRVNLTEHQDKLETHTSFFIAPDTSLWVLNDVKWVITVGAHLFVHVVVELQGMFRILVNSYDAAF